MTSQKAKKTSPASSPDTDTATQTAQKSAGRQRAIAIVVAVIAVLAVIALVAVLAITATRNAGSSSHDSANASGDLTNKVSLVSAEKGKEPTIKINAPVSVDNSVAYRRLKEGTGAVLKDGQRMCLNMAAYDAKTGKKLMSTWSTKQPDCSATHGSDSQPLRTMFDKERVGTIWAMSTPADSSSSTTSANAQGASVWVIQLSGAVTDLKKATGTLVTDVPSDLPKVTRAKNGKPSIDMNGYKGSSTLVSQDLIRGNGATVKQGQTVKVHYTGWLLDGTQFDSSWGRGATEFSLSGGVIKGWQQGLAGKKVGSQVLLVVPPTLGYGSKKQGSIPANSTLVFVVDILAAY
jgi:peptidylprolyl isomerase